MKICVIEGCCSKVKGHGFCDKHYQRFKRHGDPNVYFKKKKCTVDGCLDKYYGKGYCNKHYLRIKYHGDINHERSGLYKTPEEAWENQVIKNNDNECWGWNGALTDGYGQLRFKLNGRMLRAHRVSYEIHFGKIPAGMFVCHKCDNPICSNPTHLFLGTNLDNLNDCIKKGRHPLFKKIIAK